MIDKPFVKEFLKETLIEVKVPTDISLDDLTAVFCRYLEQDSYQWLRDNFKSFFNHGDPDWTEIRRMINESKETA
ncbi:MAG: hypothetical protein ABIK42_05485 [candidate division WOR-3 bacterium]